MNDTFEQPKLPAEPTAEERADYVILRLEQFIREGRRAAEGMSFKQWQAMAKSEIAVAIAEAEMSQAKDELRSKRVLFVSAAALVTIGFWGTAVSLHKVAYLVGGLVCLGAGLIMLAVAVDWRVRSWRERRQAKKRREILSRIESLTRRLRRLEGDLELEVETIEKKVRRLQGPRARV
jgi:hypothetical protein